MNTSTLPYATREDWALLRKLFRDPDCCMVDIHGNTAAPWQQNLCRQLMKLKDSRKWSAMPLTENGKFGLWNQFENSICVPPLYDDIEDMPEADCYSEYAITDPVPVCKEGRWGMVSPDGKNTIIIPFEYQEIAYMKASWKAVKVKQYGKYGLIYAPIEKTDPMFPCIADDIFFDETICRFVYVKNGKLGLIGVTDALFDSFRLFDDEEGSIVAVKNGQSGFLNLEGVFFAMDAICLPVADKRIKIYTIVSKELVLLKIRTCED